jgi:GTP:adenosylcobinamide-phosphate guanylyltransferase
VQDQRYEVVLLAGDRRASRSVAGGNKAFVEVSGAPMIVHVLDALVNTPEVSDVYCVGDVQRLERVLTAHRSLERAAARGRAVHIVPQRETLYENIWQAFLRVHPRSRHAARPDHTILVAPADIPLVIPEEISEFVQRARERNADYVIGLSPESALRPFAPRGDAPGIDMACFNLAEGRFRQNNLHLVRPLRVENRHYIEEMYEARYQREFGRVLALAWKVLRLEFRHLWVLLPYAVLHLAGLLDRRGHRRSADLVRRFVSLRTVERAASELLRTRFATVTTELGGAALDVDNEADLAAADKMLPVWKEDQTRAARAMLSAGD